MVKLVRTGRNLGSEKLLFGDMTHQCLGTISFTKPGCACTVPYPKAMGSVQSHASNSHFFLNPRVLLEVQATPGAVLSIACTQKRQSIFISVMFSSRHRFACTMRYGLASMTKSKQVSILFTSADATQQQHSVYHSYLRILSLKESRLQESSVKEVNYSFLNQHTRESTGA